MSSLIRKISAKAVLGASPEKPKKAINLFTVIGIAQGVQTGTTDYGEWTALKGQFEATNKETGEVFQAPKCFLPDPLNGMIAATLQETDEEGNRVNSSVQFAVEVGVKPADTATGYEYTTKEIVESNEADPLAALRDAVTKALPAPAADKSAKK